METAKASPPPPGPRAYVARSYERVATPLTVATRTAAAEDGMFCKNSGRFLGRSFAAVHASLRWVDKRCGRLSNVLIVINSSTL